MAYLVSSVREPWSPVHLLHAIIPHHPYIDHFTAFDHCAASVTGVDIDPKLVGQAKKLLALRASRARPPTKGSEHIVDWFPMSAVLRYGYIEPEYKSSSGSIPPAAASQYPRVTFFSADWVTNQDFTGPYDVILALSVSINFFVEQLGLNTPRSLSGFIWNTSIQV